MLKVHVLGSGRRLGVVPQHLRREGGGQHNEAYDVISDVVDDVGVTVKRQWCWSLQSSNLVALQSPGEIYLINLNSLVETSRAEIHPHLGTTLNLVSYSYT